jgi:hypothetical protein
VLPPETAGLINLTRLHLSGNQLTALPPEIARLTNLTDLDLSGNKLTAFPPEITRLTNLKYLNLNGSQLTVLPPEIARLTNLTDLHLLRSQLTALPPEIAALTDLAHLDLRYNQLTALPPEFGNLAKLTSPRIDNNPLPDALKGVAQRSTGELLAYLRSLQNARPLFESKLVLVGEGEVGKTSLLAAMRGENFVDGRDTTHGIEIHTLELPHPNLDQPITLNAWDFGGQPVYRVTHQFFFSRRSLYLVLWNPRMAVEQGDVEGWIKRIRLRVGDGARIIIVATHCQTGGRIARIDESQLRKDYGVLIAGFHEVDSSTGFGVEELKTVIADVAATLPQMGEPFNLDWKTARDEILALEEPRIPFSTFAEVCASHGLDETDTETLAGLMHDLGHIVYYGGDEGLADDVVLQPEWLTKAIGYVLEDRGANDESGMLEHSRLRDVWHDRVPEGQPRYDRSLHPFFLRVMEKYDVSYRLEGERSSLVAQLVPNLRPSLPWDSEDVATGGIARIALTCTMDDAPPGLVPWMTVRTHHFATTPRLHWQRGMFLRYDDYGEALLELQGRELRVTVRATWPDYFMSILRFTLERLIGERWVGLRHTFSVPCPTMRESGERCTGRFPFDSLLSFKAKSVEDVPCLICTEDNSVDELLTGFAPPDIRKQLGRIEHGVSASASEAAAWYRTVLRALSTETRECPHLFTLQPLDLNRFNPANIGREGYRLTLWCEHPEEQHPTCDIGSDGIGEYTFERPKEWFVKVTPYIALVARTLKTVVPIGGAVLKATLDESLLKDFGTHIDVMDKVATAMPRIESDTGRRPDAPNELTDAEGSGLRELHTLLLDLEPSKTWGDLRRTLAPTGEYLWLCPVHYRLYDPGLPVLD